MNWRKAVAVCLSALAPAAACAVDGVSMEGGRGNNSVDMVRIGAQWKLAKPLFKLDNDWQISSYVDATAGYWRADNTPAGRNSSLVDIGLTPSLRLSRGDGPGFFLDTGVGAHLLSHTSITTRSFSTAFQFGSHLGVGYRFGGRQSYELSARVQHLSNAAIKRPNGGINFAQLRLAYHF